jgi:SAM-dependent methyltransferase
MPDSEGIELPGGVDWRRWLDRWDRMQDRYVQRRAERLGVLAAAARDSRPRLRRVVDIGCGTGTLTERMLTQAGAEEVVGIDLDDRLLALARHRLRRHGGRVRLLRRDLRDASWCQDLRGAADAVVSATTLHWLSPEHLRSLYGQIRDVLAAGGIFLNADHVSCEIRAVQAARDEARARAIADSAAMGGGEEWEAFWAAFNACLGVDGEAFGQRVFGPWEGVEEGMPLSWHFAKLQAAGFVDCECFWRFGTDAVYGAIRPPGS